MQPALVGYAVCRCVSPGTACVAWPAPARRCRRSVPAADCRPVAISRADAVCAGAPPWHALTCVSDYAAAERMGAAAQILARNRTRVMLARLLLLKLLTKRRQHCRVSICAERAVRRARQRGYNQARWLNCWRAGSAVNTAKLRCDTVRCSMCSAPAPGKAICVARFALKWRGRHIPLIDDVVTTGSTVGKSAAYYWQGAASVHRMPCRTL